MSPSRRLSPSNESKVWCEALAPKLNFPLPMVSARSAKMGPKDSVLRLKTPSSGSKV